MLYDSERKVFTILCNYFSQHRTFPEIKLLQIKTNKAEDDLIKILTSLADQSYIEWNGIDVATIKILRFLEQPSTKEKSSEAEQVHRFYNEY